MYQFFLLINKDFCRMPSYSEKYSSLKLQRKIISIKKYLMTFFIHCTSVPILLSASDCVFLGMLAQKLGRLVPILHDMKAKLLGHTWTSFTSTYWIYIWDASSPGVILIFPQTFHDILHLFPGEGFSVFSLYRDSASCYRCAGPEEWAPVLRLLRIYSLS